MIPPPDPDRLAHHERSRLRAAAFLATKQYPGPIGEVLHDEIQTWEAFGFRLGGHSRLMRLVHLIETTRRSEPHAVRPEGPGPVDA